MPRLTTTKARKGLTDQEILRSRRDYERRLRPIRLTPAELAETRAIAARHHVHDFEIDYGVVTVTVKCKGCPLRQGAFHSWVTGRN